MQQLVMYDPNVNKWLHRVLLEHSLVALASSTPWQEAQMVDEYYRCRYMVEMQDIKQLIKKLKQRWIIQ